MAAGGFETLKKSALQALQSPVNLVTGAVSLAASAALWNPLPLILWGLGSTGWVTFASLGGRYARVIAAQERHAQLARMQETRGSLQQKLDAMLLEPPVSLWLQARLLPDYRMDYRRLVDLRNRVEKVLADRPDAAPLRESGVLEQLDSMLTSYLNFVRERIVYLQILANVRPEGRAPGEPPPPPPPPVRVDPRVANRQQPQPQPSGGAARRPLPTALPTVEERLEVIGERITELQALAQKEPATARTREWHIGILEKQRELLLECQKRDQSVAAQLAAFPDAFEVILGRVSASQFSATEIAGYMGTVVQQIEETERFVDSLRPAMDQLMSGA